MYEIQLGEYFKRETFELRYDGIERFSRIWRDVSMEHFNKYLDIINVYTKKRNQLFNLCVDLNIIWIEIFEKSVSRISTEVLNLKVRNF